MSDEKCYAHMGTNLKSTHGATKQDEACYIFGTVNSASTLQLRACNVVYSPGFERVQTTSVRSPITAAIAERQTNPSRFLPMNVGNVDRTTTSNGGCTSRHCSQCRQRLSGCSLAQPLTTRPRIGATPLHDEAQCSRAALKMYGELDEASLVSLQSNSELSHCIMRSTHRSAIERR